MVFVVIQYKDNQWQESVISPRVGQPFISPDGKTMHLGRRYMERTDTGWSEIKIWSMEPRESSSGTIRHINDISPIRI